MIPEYMKLKPIDFKPITNITPEMDAEIVRFAKELLPMVDEISRELEEIIKEEEEASGIKPCTEFAGAAAAASHPR